MKSTTRFIVAIVVSAGCALTSVCYAGSQTIALTMLIGAASLGDDGPSAVKQADELLHEARAAMKAGNLETAEAKVSRAEALHPKYSLLHTGDTPRKARAELEKMIAQKKKAGERDSQGAASGASKGGGSGSKDPFIKRPSQEFTPPSGIAETQTKPSASAAARSAGSINLSQPSSTPVAGGALPGASKKDDGPNPWEIEATAVPTLPNESSGRESASAAMVGNRYAGGAEGSTASPAETPAAGTTPAASAPPEAVIENKTTAAAAAATANAIPRSEKQAAAELTKQARAALSQGDTGAAEHLAQQANLLAPDSAFEPREDRPSLVLLDIQRAKHKVNAGAALGGVVQAGGVMPNEANRYPGLQAVHNPASDVTRNMPASSNAVQNADAPL